MERSNFANSYARAVEERAQASENNKGRSQGRSNRSSKDEQDQGKTPHYVRRNKNNRQEPNNREKQEQAPEPMEVDSSSKFRQRTNFDKSQTNDQYAQKRRNSSQRVTGPRRQRINNVVQAPKTSKKQEAEYEKAATAAVNDTDDENESTYNDDSLNFFGNAPSCRLSNANWLGEYQKY